MTEFKFREEIAGARSRAVESAIWLVAGLFGPGLANAQQPGKAAVVSMTLSESSGAVQGWSVRRGLFGRAVYASINGKQIGTVIDLVVTSAAAPYVLIIGPGGAIQIGGHAVAVPLDKVLEQAGVLILPGATRASLKAMPRFTYVKVDMQRRQFILASSAQLAEANAQLLPLRQRALAETGDEKTQLELQNSAFHANIVVAEDRLADLQKAEVGRWTLLQEAVQQAIVRMHASQPRQIKPAASAVRIP
ncbi:PRC-barrel domain-containing protein [Duganella sp. BuS-21]|uniref:PRC-barrel domain-containing protein n=1 Tax=Duganella sp. BuS-21 TaxID=2943848 RepID=UPI0035A5F5B8